MYPILHVTEKQREDILVVDSRRNEVKFLLSVSILTLNKLKISTLRTEQSFLRISGNAAREHVALLSKTCVVIKILF